jgi:ATP-binding cassette subfamily G (WHITE) protein 2 (SNQ2)
VQNLLNALTTGFCLQQDIHDESSTIREALEFSALLRQDREIPKAEKLAYVDEIIRLLELRPFQDAIVRTLNVDLKKRLTLGVELCAKPSLLLFLDEPTSVLSHISIVDGRVLIHRVRGVSFDFSGVCPT